MGRVKSEEWFSRPGANNQNNNIGAAGKSAAGGPWTQLHTQVFSIGDQTWPRHSKYLPIVITSFKPSQSLPQRQTGDWIGRVTICPKDQTSIFDPTQLGALISTT